MMFSKPVFASLIYGALALAAAGGISLIVMLLRDAKHGRIW